VADLSVSERVRELVEPVLAAEGLEVVDVDHHGATLRVFVDGPVGVDLEVISRATQLVSDVLDHDDPVPGRYTLEVSSPGVERPLRTPEHFQRFVGTTVAVRTHPDVEGERRLEGVLTAADETSIEVDGRHLSYDDIERARTVFVWGPAPKPAGPKNKSKKKAPTS
jgi:ribosome maturation factor RimP